MRRQYNDLWSEDESREQEAQDPIPESIIFPQLPLRGTIVIAIMIAIGALGSVGEIEPDDRQTVGECGQDPGQELNWRELGKIRSQLLFEIYWKKQLVTCCTPTSRCLDGLTHKKCK